MVACWKLGNFYMTDENKRDLPKALELLTKACDGDSASCSILTKGKRKHLS